MGSLGRIGLQKRIFLYVATGVALMLSVFAYLGLRAVRHSTDLVFEERLTLAQELAAGLSLGFAHVAKDVKEDMAGVNNQSDRLSLEKAVGLARYHVAEVDKFPLFKIGGFWLITREKQLVAEPSQPLPYDEAWITSHFNKDFSLKVLSPPTAEDRSFVYLLMPLVDTKKEVWSLALINTLASSSPQPFTPLEFLGLDTDGSEPPRQSRYILEITSPENIVLLSIGSPKPVGRLSSHLSLIKTLRGDRGSNVMLHRLPDAPDDRDHVVASVPVPGSDLYLLLEQEKDIALALPNELLRQLMLFGSVGFLVTLFTAWVTTRNVVKPTMALIHDSERLAKGDLATPVTVRAQDEIGRLAENLETMRQRLNSALQDLEETNKGLEARVRERTQLLSEALGKIISAQEEERRRLARELHDETAQALVTLSLVIDGIRDKALVDPSAARQQALEAKELANNLLEGTRRLIFDLRPTVLDDFGLVSALRWCAERYLEDRGIEVVFKAGNPTLPAHLQVAMFRIAQEAINNIAKHSQAKQARIEVSNDDKVISLVVEDDGQGFNLARNWSQGTKVGLVGMRERANLLGAKLEISSFPGKGTRVYLEVPQEPYNA